MRTKRFLSGSNLSETSSQADGYKSLAVAVMACALKDAQSDERCKAMDAIGWWLSDDAAMFCEAFGYNHDRAICWANHRKESYMTEHDEQRALIDWVHLNQTKHPELRLLYATPNAGKRSVGAAKWMQAEGMRKGVPDLCLPCARNGYHGLYIEMKVEGGRMRPEQKEYLRMLQDQDYCAVIAWSADEAIQIIEEYLDGADA